MGHLGDALSSQHIAGTKEIKSKPQETNIKIYNKARLTQLIKLITKARKSKEVKKTFHIVLKSTNKSRCITSLDRARTGQQHS